MGDEIYADEFRAGTFSCASCGNVLYNTSAKFSSKEGTPAFRAPAAEGAVFFEVDDSIGIERTGIYCSKCKELVGHLFNDAQVAGDVNGSKQRHSVYSKSLKFQPDSEDADPIPLTPAKVEEVKIEVIEKTETKPAEHVHKPTVKVTVPAGKSKAQLLHELEEDDSSSESSNDDSSDDDDTQPAPTKVAPLAPQRTHMHATAAKAAANKEKSSGSSWAIAGVTVAAVAVAGYFGYRYYRNQK